MPRYNLYRSTLSRRGFTLTEMLVVIAIIAVLAALLLPAVMGAITTARNTVIAVEVNQLAQAIEQYRAEKNDYPPNFRDKNVVLRHISKCYPRIDQQYLQYFMNQVFPPSGTYAYQPGVSQPIIDESESLVFWLSMTDTDPQYPFLSYRVNNASGTPYPPSVQYDANGNTILPGKLANPKKYFDFDQTRLNKTLNDVPSYKAKFSGETYYIYIDSRSYSGYDKGIVPPQPRTDLVQFSGLDGKNTFAISDDANTGVRPYWTSPPTISTALNPPFRASTICKAANPTTFQIICAGQDGDFGTGSETDVKIATGALAGTNFNPADKDNITNFSGGKRLGDLIP